MKKLQFIGLVVFGLSLFACQQIPQQKTAPVTEENSAEQTTAASEAKVSFETASKATLKIDGMMCAMGCAAKIEKNLADAPGILEAQVDFEAASGRVVFNPELTTAEQIIAVVEKSGESYKVADLQVAATE